MAKSKHNKKITTGKKPGFTIDLVAATVTGVFTAAVFNPWDRALYLSVKHHRPFILAANFKQPFYGFGAAILHRTLSGGSYFLLQSQVRLRVSEPLQKRFGFGETQKHFMTGLLAGSINGFIFHPLAAIRYQRWNKKNVSLVQMAREMYLHGGFSSFMIGRSDGFARDVLFGCVYEVIRQSLHRQVEQTTLSHDATQTSAHFSCDLVAAGVATIASAPFNYTRNMKFKTKPGQVVPSTWLSLKLLSAAARKEPTRLAALLHLQRALGIGYGTARVAVGMAVGQGLFQVTKRYVKCVKNRIEQRVWRSVLM